MATLASARGDPEQAHVPEGTWREVSRQTPLAGIDRRRIPELARDEMIAEGRRALNTKGTGRPARHACK